MYARLGPSPTPVLPTTQGAGHQVAGPLGTPILAVGHFFYDRYGGLQDGSSRDETNPLVCRHEITRVRRVVPPRVVAATWT